MPSIRNAGASLALFAVTSVANSQLTPSDFYTPEYYANSGLQYTNAADAYALGFTGLGIKLGIADDQAQLSHPEFAGRVYSPLRPAPFPNPEYPDFPEHGTHVMGVAAAARNNVGMMGVAYNASIANVVAVPDPGYPGADDWAQQLVDAGVSVMNASFGPPEAPSPELPDDSVNPNFREVDFLFIKKADISEGAKSLKVLSEADIVMVFAAGNERMIQPFASKIPSGSKSS